MGLIRKVASIMMLGGVSSHTGREPPGKAEWVRAKAERARKKAAEAQAVRAEAEAKVAEEQAAALARALHEDEAQRPPAQRQHSDAHADRPSPGDVGRVMHAVHDPGHTHGRRERPDRCRQAGISSPTPVANAAAAAACPDGGGLFGQSSFQFVSAAPVIGHSAEYRCR